MQRRDARGLLGPLMAGLALLLGGPTPGEACCPAAPPGAEVKIADQEVLIAWDPATRTQHFVRRAHFASATPGFGFLVPSPTRPEVAEADGAVFDRLRTQIQPRVVEVARYVPTPTALLLWPLLASREQALRSAATGHAQEAAQEARVRVLEAKRVAGFDVAVLAAKDAGALTTWLGENGYEARPELTAWAEPYVAQGWIVTAFKYAAEPGRVDAGTVRMSFETDRPLFPYRVPTDQLAPAGRGNLLRTYVVGPGRAAGALGAAGAPYAQAEVAYAQPLEATRLTALLQGGVPGAPAAGGQWLTAFEDPTWPGGTEDLFFALDPAGAPFERVIEHEVRREVPIPLDVLAAVGLGALLLVRRRGKGAARPL